MEEHGDDEDDDDNENPFAQWALDRLHAAPAREQDWRRRREAALAPLDIDATEATTEAEEARRAAAKAEEEPGSSVSFTALPIVKFALADGRTVTRCIEPAEWAIDEGEVRVASRTQVPLKLAWALSIHKSQGMTIGLLEADVGKCFDYGQCYVALSRAVSLSSLRVLNFDPRRVKANQRVLEFNARLETVHAEEHGKGAVGTDGLRCDDINQQLLLDFYEKHAPERATAEAVLRLLQTYTPETIEDGIAQKYGAAIALRKGEPPAAPSSVE